MNNDRRHHDRIEVAAEIEAGVERVWLALTAERGRWWPELRAEASPGAAVHEQWTENGERMSATGIVTRVDAGSLLEFQWTEPAWNSSLVVSFAVTGDDRAARVVVTESGFGRLDDGDALRSEHIEGWRFHLHELAVFVTGSR
ncbi:SRPBCC domain-containing protein [Marisediminicola sp. LYQ134]|uniref:SRPBCC domain-containing protein n=1 Tax=unclassified Marisediminicola TaxID=2618316 RepID=UPI0039832DEE